MVCCCAAISACEKGEQCKTAFRLLPELVRRLLAPVVVSGYAVISACKKGKQWDAVLGLLQKLVQRSLVPNVLCCSAAVSACEKGVHWETPWITAGDGPLIADAECVELQCCN